MAAYDSDSSLDDELDVQTNVTLGYASSQPTDDDISQIGGHPTFLDPAMSPPASFAKCKICNSYMSLLLKLQADLSQQFPGEERRLYVWSCRKKQCSRTQGSIRAFRETRKPKPKPSTQQTTQKPAQSQPPAQTNLGSQLFGNQTSSSNINPFSGSSSTNPFSSSQPTNILSASSLSDLKAKPPQSPQPPTETFAEKLKISESPPPSLPQDPWPSTSSFPSPFPHLHLEAEAEYLEPKPQSSSSNPTPALIDESEPTPSSDKDLYESPHDKTFDHFTQLLSQNPEQVLRYEHSGQPLLYSSSDAIASCFVVHGKGPVKGIPRCSCSSARVFEMQLVPNLIFEVEKDNEEAMKIDGKEGMEWGTVILGTCSRNCGDEGVSFREEWVGVQWEEGGMVLKQK